MKWKEHKNIDLSRGIYRGISKKYSSKPFLFLLKLLTFYVWKFSLHWKILYILAPTFYTKNLFICIWQERFTIQNDPCYEQKNMHKDRGTKFDVFIKILYKSNKTLFSGTPCMLENFRKIDCFAVLWKVQSNFIGLPK